MTALKRLHAQRARSRVTGIAGLRLAKGMVCDQDDLILDKRMATWTPPPEVVRAYTSSLTRVVAHGVKSESRVLGLESHVALLEKRLTSVERDLEVALSSITALRRLLTLRIRSAFSERLHESISSSSFDQAALRFEAAANRLAEANQVLASYLEERRAEVPSRSDD